MSDAKTSAFNRMMKLIDEALEQLRKAPRVHDKQRMRFAIDEMMTKIDPTGLNAKQLARIEQKRHELDKALSVHEQGN